MVHPCGVFSGRTQLRAIDTRYIYDICGARALGYLATASSDKCVSLQVPPPMLASCMPAPQVPHAPSHVPSYVEHDPCCAGPCVS